VTVFRNAEDPNEVMALFEWDDPANLKAFLDDPEVQAVIKPGTVAPPQVFVASGAEDFPA
jgi:quinol monooxygenase YgiN